YFYFWDESVVTSISNTTEEESSKLYNKGMGRVHHVLRNKLQPRWDIITPQDKSGGACVQWLVPLDTMQCGHVFTIGHAFIS
ncbi:hypothetical protein SO802_012749, partial [Lithocarpus litseifolius]